MKVKAKMKKDMAVVKLLAKHPNGNRVAQRQENRQSHTSKIYPKSLSASMVIKWFLKLTLVRAVSKNPYVSFSSCRR